VRHVTAQQLSAFLDGALSGVSRELVTRHLAACADCRERHALWHIYDEVLQRVLSWEPDEHTMEQASARVELALTAERRGLAPPEFTSVLNPVSAAGPASPSTSGMFPALPPLTPLQGAMHRPVAAAPPAPPAPVPPPAPVNIHITPSANSYPLDPPEFAPPPAPPAPYMAPVAPPAPAPPQWYAPHPPPAGAAPWYPPPAGATPWYPPPAPPAGAAPWYPPPAPPAGAAQWYAPPPPAGYTPPISPHEDLRAHGVPHASRWASTPVPPKQSPWGRALLIGAAVLGVLLLLSTFLPDVIRIRVPEGRDASPTVELVHRDAPTLAPEQQQRLAERTSSEPPLVPYRALPADSAAARSTPAEAPQGAHSDSALAPPAVVAAPPKPAVTAKAHAPARIRPRVSPEPESEDEGGTAAGVEHSTTFVPVSVKTEVRLSSSQPSSQASSPPAPAADTAGDPSLPLLCGEVVDESGAPIEGARVQVMVPALTIRTDKRGRFCVALPAGERTFLVDAAGFQAVTRGVELSGATFETHVTLTAAR